MEPPLHKWQDCFSDPVLEADFMAYTWPRQVRRMRIFLLLTVAFELLAIIIDYANHGFGPGFHIIPPIRLAAAAVGFSAAYSSRAKTGYRTFFLLFSIYGLLVGLVEAVELPLVYSPLSEMAPPFSLIIVLFFYLFLPPRSGPVMFIAFSSSVLYLLSLAFFTPGSGGNLVSMILFFAATNLLGVHFLVGHNRVQRKAFWALRQEKHLNRLLEREMRAKDEANRLLKIQASTDPLTGLANRRSFFEVLSKETERANRYGRALSVLMIDIDHFKAINDRYGHEAGDLALRHLAETCRRQLRETDHLGRLGGEEFCAILPETGEKEAAIIAERMRKSVESSVLETPEGKINPTISLGLAGAFSHSHKPNELMRQADRAMYLAKKAGRNRVMTVTG